MTVEEIRDVVARHAEWVAVCEPCLPDLLCVGPDKPLGYLPLSTVRGAGRNALELMLELGERQGRAAVILPEGPRCRIGSGALYACDLTALGALLDAHADLLRARG
jgi:hypothetical protein